MGITLLLLICPSMLLLSVTYPLIRGWKRVKLLKSLLLGWLFFVTGCLFREYLTPWLAVIFIGDHAREQVECLNSYMIFGISLGWIIPLFFHFTGSYCRTISDKRKTAPL